MIRVRPARATILGRGRGILTPDLCQICKQGPPGIVTVQRVDGRGYFSAHAWPCAERAELRIVGDEPRP